MSRHKSQFFDTIFEIQGSRQKIVKFCQTRTMPKAEKIIAEKGSSMFK